MHEKKNRDTIPGKYPYIRGEQRGTSQKKQPRGRGDSGRVWCLGTQAGREKSLLDVCEGSERYPQTLASKK